MDWAESEELMAIYLTEVDQRSKALSDGARALTDGSLDASRHEDLIRDAHTLKGSSYVVGRTELGQAAEVLERGWKQVHEADATWLPVLGTAMLELSSAIGPASRQTDLLPALAESATLLRGMLAHDGSSRPVPHATSVSNVSIENLWTAATPQSSASADESQPDPPTIASQVTLGGLLPSPEGTLGGWVMRVDAGALYTLINRVVEIGIELESLDDLALVSFGEDQSRLLSGWRAQITRLSQELAELRSDAVSLVNVPLSEAVETFPQFVRFLGRRLGKNVRLELKGAEILVDRQIVDLLREPLRHLVVNAVDHGVETQAERVEAGKLPTAVVRLSAELEDGRLVVSVGDDGRGIDWNTVRDRAEAQGLTTSQSELRSHLMREGFTTVVGATDFSGTGEGLALLADAVDDVAGSVMIQSVTGEGTTVMIDLPVSLVLQRIVTVTAADQVYGLSEAAVIDAVSPVAPALRSAESSTELLYKTERVPYVSLASALGLAGGNDDEIGLILTTRSGLVAVGVGENLGQRSVAVKSVGAILEGADHVAGAAFLGGGQVLVIVDHNHLGVLARQKARQPTHRPKVLVVDDSAGVRQLIAATLRGNGFEVELAANGVEALGLLEDKTFDALVVDYSMPDSNGADVVRSIRSTGTTMPIVMVSGVAEEKEKAIAWEAGVDAYLDKYDLRRGALTESIERLLAERSAPRG